MISLYKFVEFDKYCTTCKYAKVLPTDDPCDECLGNPTNINSHKPVNYKKKGAKK